MQVHVPMHKCTHTKFSFASENSFGGYGILHFIATWFWKVYFLIMCEYTCVYSCVSACRAIGFSYSWRCRQLNQTLQDQYTFLTIEPSSQPPYFYFLFYFKHLQHFGFCWRNWGRHTVLICNTFPVAALFHSVFYSQYLSLHVSACVLLEIEHRALHIPHKYFTNCTPAQPLLGRILVFGRVLFCFVLFVLFFKNSDHISFSPGL